MTPLTVAATHARLEPGGLPRRPISRPVFAASPQLCRPHHRLVQVLWASAALLALSAQTANSASPQLVTRATEILDRWQPGQHLYVKGELGVGQAQLSQLEAWLASHAPHWTVALIESAAGETFTDAAGETFTGMDAIEHGLGKGLPNRTSFGALTDPRTGERNGAFLVIFLRERKFSYFASEAHDRRALGEDHWVGRLDQPAIAAMRDGGRIVDAVRDTITQIEDRLSRTIAAETAELERQETATRLARQNELEQARASLASASQAVDLLETKIRQLRQSRPNLTGELIRPDLEVLRANLNAAQNTLTADQPAAARTLADTTKQQAIGHTDALERYLAAGDDFATLTEQMDQITRRPHGTSAQPTLDQARATLNEAQTAHDRADPAYAQLLISAREQLSAADHAAQAAATRAARQTQMRLAVSVLALLALLALGVILNRRRRPQRLEALELLAAWSAALADKSVALVELVDRAQSILGLSSEDVSTRFTGLTLELGQQTVRDVDEACIMAVCAQRIHRSAEAWARPTRLGPRLHNFFGGRRYQAAIRQLRDEPVVFHPDERLEVAVRGPKTTHDRLLGHLESYQPFRLSFNELMDAFNQRSGRALNALDRIHTSLTHLGTLSSSLEHRIQSLQTTEPTLSEPTSPPHLFRLPTLFDALIPAAQADWAEADQIGVQDPISALETHLAAAQRKCADAEALARVALAFHHETYPALAEATRKLKTEELAADWIDAEAAALSDQAEDLARQACGSPMTASIAQLAQDLEQLLSRTATTVALDQNRRDRAIPALDATDQTIAGARQKLALRLNLDPTDILRESSCDPSTALTRAREQVAAAKTALELGDTDAAQRALDAAAASCAEATAIVESTTAAADRHAERLASCRTETERLEGSLPAHTDMLATMTTACEPSALLLGQGDPTHPNANGTVADNLAEAGEHLRAARQLADHAAEAFGWARILEADALLDQAAAAQNQAGFRLTEIAEKQERIHQTEIANKELARSLAAKLEELAPALADLRTTTQSTERFKSLRQQLAETETRRTAPVRNPFAIALDLDTLQQALAQTADAIRHDWTLHAETDAALQAGATELEMARRLAQNAATDSIADSAAIAHASGELSTLHHSHQTARHRLAEPHGDWHALAGEADRILHDATRITALLRHELEAAAAAQTALSAAIAQVRAASGWRGLLGVTILGAPGAEQLRLARTSLSQGAYQEARQAAEAALHAAALAIAQAQAEQRRRERAEQERRDRERRQREEAERRRRQAARSSSFGSGAFGGSSGARRSGFSSGSGAARSSFKSSSGARRSGW